MLPQPTILFADVLQSVGQTATYSGNILLVVAVVSVVIGFCLAVYGAVAGAMAYDTAIRAGRTVSDASRSAAAAAANAGGALGRFISGKRTYLFCLALALTAIGWWCREHEQAQRVTQSINFDFTTVPTGEYEAIASLLVALIGFFGRAALSKMTADQKAKAIADEAKFEQIIAGYDGIKKLIPNSDKLDGIEDVVKKIDAQVKTLLSST
jgi:hypothetical protein